MSRYTRRELIAELQWQIRARDVANDLFDEAALERLGVNRTDGRCIDILQREGRVTAGQLAQAAGLTTGAVTAVLDRLERAGYARRLRDTADRRRVLVEPTEKTHRVAADLYGELAREGTKALRRYTLEELEAIVDFLRLDRQLKERQLERLTARRPRRAR